MSISLTEDQIAQYEKDGYLILRNAIPESDIQRMERGFARNPPLDGTLNGGLKYPEPGRYTLANSSLKDPDLGFIVEHENIVPPVRQLLNDEPKLTAYVLYDRTPGGPGIPAHNDYKRWRPVGSSMNWLFTIIPFCDYDDQTGQLFVAPGSHEPERAQPSSERPMTITPPTQPKDTDFIDPELKRGDLLFMNMYLWHRASPNKSTQHRVGIFNKYAAQNAPPATGYYIYDNDVYNTLTPAGRELLAIHSDRELAMTRSVITRRGAHSDADPEILMVESGFGQWTLPGGPAAVERAIPDWDLGNVIDAAQHHLREQLAIETPWLSWVGDFDEGDGLARIYGYDLNGLGFPVAYNGRWVAASEVADLPLAHGYEAEAVSQWLDPTPIRGKGLSQARSRVDQYAY